MSIYESEENMIIMMMCRRDVASDVASDAEADIVRCTTLFVTNE